MTTSPQRTFPQMTSMHNLRSCMVLWVAVFAVPIISTAEHKVIFEFLKRGDADGAREAFRRHRQRTAAELISILENYRLPQL